MVPSVLIDYLIYCLFSTTETMGKKLPEPLEVP
jgi:hypothetical protein